MLSLVTQLASSTMTWDPSLARPAGVSDRCLLLVSSGSFCASPGLADATFLLSVEFILHSEATVSSRPPLASLVGVQGAPASPPMHAISVSYTVPSRSFSMQLPG